MFRLRVHNDQTGSPLGVSSKVNSNLVAPIGWDDILVLSVFLSKQLADSNLPPPPQFDKPGEPDPKTKTYDDHATGFELSIIISHELRNFRRFALNESAEVDPVVVKASSETERMLAIYSNAFRT